MSARMQQVGSSVRVHDEARSRWHSTGSNAASNLRKSAKQSHLTKGSNSERGARLVEKALPTQKRSQGNPIRQDAEDREPAHYTNLTTVPYPLTENTSCEQPRTIFVYAT
jgi:hypothetical protein